MPKISVVICAYNAARFLKNAVASVLGQTFKDIELIIVNDGSGDSTLAVAYAYRMKDRRVKCIDIPNGGLSNARNVGISAATGEYIAFCDADDSIDENALEALYSAAVASNADVVIAGYHHDTVLSNGKVFTNDVFTEEAVFETRNELLKHLPELKSKYLLDPSWNKLYRLSIITDNGLKMPVGELFEDTAFCLDVLSVCGRVMVIENCFYHYMQRDSGSITKSYNPDKPLFLKKRYFKLSEFVGDDKGLQKYCALYHLRNMYSSIADFFGSEMTTSERRRAAEKIIKDEVFSNAAIKAGGGGMSDRVTVLVARSGSVRLSLLYARILRFFKKRMKRLFFKLK